MKTGIFFDLDGTLWDSSSQVVMSWNQTFEENNLNIHITEDDMKSCMGKLMKDIADILMASVTDDKERYDLLAVCENNENQLIRKVGGKLFDNVEKMLGELSSKYDLFIVSNCQAGYIEAFLEHYNFNKYFKDKENPGVTGLAKGDNIKLVAERNSIDNIIYIGDTQGDYEATLIAGGNFIHAAYGFGQIDALVAKAESIMDIPLAVERVIEQVNGQTFYNSRKLALDDHILLQVEKPARYLGNEVNVVKKDPGKVDVRFCMCFPDLYEIGMSHLGIQILYDMFNSWTDVYCERVYSPWTDLDAIMREKNIPLFALESQQPVKQFDFLGITLQYEMCYTNILQILELSQIPLFAKDRGQDDPLVFGGGPCAYNAEPIADFFDLFYIGEGETNHRKVIDLYKKVKSQGGSRQDFLRQAASIPCIYVPSLYDISYNEDGTVAAINPKYEDVPKKVKKDIVLDLDNTYYPTKPLVPFIKATQDRVVLEIQRGCIRGCRFCQAGQVYRPVRERSLNMLKKTAYEMLNNTGHEEISLSSLSSSDYSELEGLVNFLIDEFKSKHVNISLPSLRIDAFSLDVMSKVQDIKKSSLTFAPEAGSQRMRDVINKGLTEESIIDGAMMAFKSGWNKVKLYFMLGLPFETEEDNEAIMDLCEKIAEEYYTIPKEERNGKVAITASTSFFIPKPFTPFQWAPMCTKEDFLDKARITNAKRKTLLNQKSIKYNWHEADLSELEGIFARGDRRLSRLLLAAYKKGCIFDSWSECFEYSKWQEAIEETGVDIDFYITRERDESEIFPWDVIDTGVTKAFLLREWHNAKEGNVTPNCKMKCSGCGAASFGGGICFEG